MTNRNLRMAGCLRRNRSAVSEVVGSVMLLLMTVGVFSGIILFVNSIQGPGNQTFVDLIPSIDRFDANNGRVKITHAGGQPLAADTTAIAIQVNSTRYIFMTVDGLTPVNNQWVTGQQWTYTFSGGTLSQNASVQILVVDQAHNQLVLFALVQRGIGIGGAFPIIGSTQVLPNGAVQNSGIDMFKVRVIAVDYDNDLPNNGVKVDFSPLACGVANQTLTNTGFGVFESTSFTALPSSCAVGSYGLPVSALDLVGHKSNASLLFVVTASSSNAFNFSGSGPFGLPFSSEFQAYEIYNGTEWSANGFNGTGTRKFVKGETVVVVLASQYIKNVDLQNDVMLYSSTGLPVQPIVYSNSPYGQLPSKTSLPSSNGGFQFLQFTGGFFIWIYTTSTSSATMGFDGVQLAYGHYTLDMAIRASNVAPPRNRFATVDYIDVTDASGALPAYPKLSFYNDSNYLNQTLNFRFTDIAYVQVTVATTNANPTFSSITISDYIGGAPIWASAGISPVSNVTAASATQYRFNIDLSAPNKDAWIFGRNAYGFRIAQVIDDDEKYELDGQLIVTGPRWALDAFAGINEYAQQVHSQKWYATFYKDDQQWARTLVEYFDSAPSAKTPDWGGGPFRCSAVGDLDRDGDLDAVFGADVGRLFLYRNNGGLGTSWSRLQVDNLAAGVTAVAIGRVDADLANDIVAGTSGGQVWLYTNDGRWTPTLIASLTSQINEIRIADVTGDGARDLVVATAGGNVVVFVNDGTGGFGTYLTQDYTMASDSAVQGTVTNTYTSTQTSNNVYESIKEVNGSGQTIDLYTAVGEVVPAYGAIESGSYADTVTSAGPPFEVLTESFYDGPGTSDRWLLRNSSAGASPGHVYDMGTIPTLGGGDTASVTLAAFLSNGTERMEVRYQVGAGALSGPVGNITSTSISTQSISLPGFTGGHLYLILQDTDSSFNDASSDGIQTKIAVDYLAVQITHVTGTTSRLEHKWQTSAIGAGGNAYKVFVEGYHSTSAEGDDFLLQWSSTGTSNWTTLVTISKTVDDDIPQFASLPSTVSGTQIWLRVVDMDRTPNNLILDTVYLDSIVVRRFITTPNTQTIAVGTAVKTVAVGDVNADGKADIVVGAGSNVKVYYGTTWTSSSTIAAGATVESVGVGYFDGGNTLDIATGLSTGDVTTILQTSLGSFSSTTIANVGSGVNRIRTADVDDDLWDDVVVGNTGGQVIWLRHSRGTTWQSRTIEDLGTAIYDISIGDAQRGVVIGS